MLYTLNWNCYGIGAIGLSLLFEFCHMNLYTFCTHYHSKLDIQNIINTSPEHTSNIPKSPNRRISLNTAWARVGVCFRRMLDKSPSTGMTSWSYRRVFTAHTTTNKRMNMCGMNALIYLIFLINSDKQPLVEIRNNAINLWWDQIKCDGCQQWVYQSTHLQSTRCHFCALHITSLTKHSNLRAAITWPWQYPWCKHPNNGTLHFYVPFVGGGSVPSGLKWLISSPFYLQN